MSRASIRGVVVATAVAAAVSAGSAQATQNRSFVASNGNDANSCQLAAPCRTFTAAIAQTNPGGEVIVLDAAGYGPVTITGPISLIAPPGIYAGISVTSGAGIVVNAGTGDVVALRGLDITGLGGTNGIVVAGGKRVIIDRCSVTGFGSGSALALTTSGQTNVDVTDTVLRDSQIGASFTATGILNEVNFTRVRLESNGTGVSATGTSLFLRMVDTHVQGSGGDGLHFDPAGAHTVRFDVQRGAIVGNNIAVYAAPTTSGGKVLGVINEVLVAENGSFGIYANANAGATATLEIWNTVSRYNGSGIRIQQAGSTAVIRNNIIVDNGFGIACVGCGGLLTGGGNLNYDNGTPGAPTGGVSLQ